MITQSIPIPAFAEGAEWTERRAKLFEAGEFPDKGVSISCEHLAEIATRFGEPVPVLIEHSESPFELGYLVAVAAEGAELFGRIALTKEADALVERSGAKSLSIGLSPDLSEIREVSLVKSPRVADARLFSCGGLYEPVPTYENTRARMQQDWKAKFQALEAQTRSADAERTVCRLIGEGRLLPAEAGAAKALLQAAGAVEFDGGSQPIAQLFLAMIEKRIPHGLFSELAPSTSSASQAPHSMLPEEAEFYRRHFPDVGLDVIAGIRRGGAA